MKATLYHIVWAVKDWEKLLTRIEFEEIRRRLDRNFTLREAKLVCAGGGPDHIHALVELGGQHRLSRVVGWVKGESSHWFNRKFDRSFRWQKGYAATEVSRTEEQQVRSYITSHPWLTEENHLHEEFTRIRSGTSVM